MPILEGYKYVIPFTIPASKLTGDLSWFPVRISLGASSGVNNRDLTHLFQVVGNDYSKIAITQSDGVTQVYAEVELWDSVTPAAELWVSRDGWNLSSTTDNHCFIYYDSVTSGNSHVGVTGSAAGKAVWNSDFKMVQHMNDDPDTSHIADSTVNDNDGTKTLADNPIESEAVISKGQDFGGDDNIEIDDSASLDITSVITVEAWINPDSIIGDHEILRKSRTTDYSGNFEFKTVTNDLFFYIDTDVTLNVGAVSVNSISVGDWLYCVGIYNGTHIMAATNTVFGTSVAVTGNILTSNDSVWIGVRDRGGSGKDLFFDGIIDEVRISNIARSSAWVGASYQTQTDSLIFYGAPTQVTASVTTIGGKQLSYRKKPEPTFFQKNGQVLELYTVYLEQKIQNKNRLVSKLEKLKYARN